MKISSKTHHIVRLHQILFYLLLFLAVGLLAKFTVDHNYSWDWTQNSRHTLSDSTQQVLATLESEIEIKAFVSPTGEYRRAIAGLLNRYHQYSNLLNVTYIDPVFSPELVRQFEVQQQGEMLVSHGGKQEHLYDLSEQSLTNAIVSVSRQQDKWLIFIEGHGERSPFSPANFNLSTWGDQLKLKGLKFKALNLVEHSQIPENTAAVIIASPKTAWIEGEIDIVKSYVDAGGNLLWLTEPDSHQHLSSLAEQLDIEFTDGTIIDPNAELLGINDPQFVLITDYANHPVGAASTTSVSLFPQAVAIETNTQNSDWQHLELLNTQNNTWSETQTITQDSLTTLKFDEGSDTSGPLTLGYLLTRLIDDSLEQRIAVIGDGDFASNTYIGNGGNLSLSLALMNWLTHDDDFISIPVKTTLDSQLNLSKTQSLVIALGFLLVSPIFLLAMGASVWWSRRRR